MRRRAVVATLQLEGAYQLSQFKLANDKAGGSLITVNTGVMDRLTYVSSAGGAFLEWLEGKTLPGVAVLLVA